MGLNYIDVLEKLFSTLNQIGENIGRFQQYEAFFGESERLKSALGLIYADILKLAVGAAIFYRRNGFSEGARTSCVYNMRLIVLMGLRKFRDEHLPQF
jgi:hypothetical protein